jgi:MoaD family protein
MIRVKLILLDDNLRSILGVKETLFEMSEDEATIKELIKKIAEAYGDKALRIILKPETSILLNGQYVEFLGGVDAKLSDGDRVAIIPLIAGG